MDSSRQGIKNTKASGDKEMYFHVKKHEKVVFVEKTENVPAQGNENQQSEKNRQFKDTSSNRIYIPKSQIENKTNSKNRIEDPQEMENRVDSEQDNSKNNIQGNNLLEGEKTNGKGSNQAVDNVQRYSRSNGEHRIVRAEETAEQEESHLKDKNKGYYQAHLNQSGKYIQNAEKVSQITGIHKKTQQYFERSNNHKPTNHHQQQDKIDGYDIQQINESIPYRPIRFSKQMQQYSKNANNQGVDHHHQKKEQKKDNNNNRESSFDSLQEEYNLDINIKDLRSNRIPSGSTQMYVQASNVKNDKNTIIRNSNKQHKQSKNEEFQNNYQQQKTKKKEYSQTKFESKKQQTQVQHETKWIPQDQANDKQQGKEELSGSSGDYKSSNLLKNQQKTTEKRDEKLQDSTIPPETQHNQQINATEETEVQEEDQERNRKEIKRQLIREKLANNTSTDRFFYMPKSENEDKESENEGQEDQYGGVNDSRMMAAAFNGQLNNKMILSGQQNNSSNSSSFSYIQQQPQNPMIQGQQSVNPFYPQQMIYYYYPVNQSQQQLHASTTNAGIPLAAARPQEEAESKTNNIGSQELQQSQQQLQGIGNNTTSAVAPTVLGRYPSIIPPQQQYQQFLGNMMRPQFVPVAPNGLAGINSAQFIQPPAQTQSNQQAPSLQALKQQQQQVYQQPIMQGYQPFQIQQAQYQYGNQYYQLLADQQHASMQSQQQQQYSQQIMLANFQQQQQQMTAQIPSQAQITSPQQQQQQQQLISLSGQQLAVPQAQQQPVQQDQSSKQRDQYSTESAEQSTITAITAASNMSATTLPSCYFSDYAEELNHKKEELLWMYIDKQQNQQGPFASIHMDLWNKQGYFPEELLIQFIHEQKWITLQEFQKQQEEKDLFSENS